MELLEQALPQEWHQVCIHLLWEVMAHIMELVIPQRFRHIIIKIIEINIYLIIS